MATFSKSDGGALPPSENEFQDSVSDRSIGDLIRQTRTLTDKQVEQILSHQRKYGLRFGESAVALKLASSEDVLRALSQQFHYPYARELTNETGDSELVVASSPFSDDAEAFRELRSQLMMGGMGTELPRRALAVLSPNVGDGKTFVAANIAVAFSQLGSRTLLVDADMRTPRLHKIFGIGKTSGLSSILSGRAADKPIHQIAALPSLHLLPVGAIPPNPLELAQRPAFALLMGEMLRKFDYVIVDTPAASHGADAKVIAAKCGAALAIGRRGKTSMPALDALIKSLAKGPAKFTGIVLNNN